MNADTKIEVAVLEASSEEMIYGWLRRESHKKYPTYSIEDIEKRLLGRCLAKVSYDILSSPFNLITLGLARYARSPTTIEAIYAGYPGTSVAYAALSNPNLAYSRTYYGENILRAVVNSSDDLEIVSLAANTRLNNGILLQLLRRKDAFFGLSDDRFREVLYKLSQNPRTFTPPKESFVDSYEEHEYNSVFGAIWKLSLELPVTEYWSHPLVSIFQRTLRESFFGEDVTNAITRWQRDSTARDYDSFEDVRSFLADNLYPDDGLLQSEDRALRRSFYRRFYPSKYTEWQAFIDKDGEVFFDSALENLALWCSEDNRRSLRRIAYNISNESILSDGCITSFLLAESRMQKKFPAWFKDSDDQKKDDVLERLLLLQEQIDSYLRNKPVQMEYKFEQTALAIEEKILALSETIQHSAQIEHRSASTEPAIPNELNRLQSSIEELHKALTLVRPASPATVMFWLILAFIIGHYLR